MTYEERKKQVCDACDNHKNNCGYRCRQLNDKCEYLQTVMEGWELGRKDAVEDTCEWFENSLCCYIRAQTFTIEHDRMEKDYRKEME